MTEVAGIADELAAAGLDIAHAFDAPAVARAVGVPALGAAPLGVVVGNTRAMWQRFVAAYRADDELRASADPIDRYVERVVDRAIARVPGATWLAAHRSYDGAGDYLPFQRIAVAAGLGAMSASQLVIHPEYGPWFALRAIILCTGEPPARRDAAFVCRCGDSCPRAFAAASASTDWRAWVAVRDACPVGTSWRYSEQQIAYHYTKDRSLL